MRKLVKILTMLIVVSLLCLNVSAFAAPNTVTNNATGNTASSENATSNTAEATKTEENATTASEATESSTSSTKVTSVDSVDENSLTTSDIINIFLIAVCVILILLGIAILIRLK